MASNETYDALLKVIVIGDSSVGKTCLILRYTQDTFRENFLSTIGVDFKTKAVEFGKRRYKLQIWDTAGQERYNTIRKNFYRGAKGVVIVYDVTNPDSFGSLTRWINDISTNVGDEFDKPVVLVLGNKIDREFERKVSRLTGEQACYEFRTQFAEVSALTGSGVEEAFNGMVAEMVSIHRLPDKRTDYSGPSIELSPPDSKTRRTGCSFC